jgi:hypothetical protein
LREVRRRVGKFGTHEKPRTEKTKPKISVTKKKKIRTLDKHMMGGKSMAKLVRGWVWMSEARSVLSPISSFKKVNCLFIPFESMLQTPFPGRPMLNKNLKENNPQRKI